MLDAMTLRERCQRLLDTRLKLSTDDLVEFVVAENGRVMAGNDKLAEALPLVLYFKRDADRSEFITTVESVFDGTKIRIKKI